MIDSLMGVRHGVLSVGTPACVRHEVIVCKEARKKARQKDRATLKARNVEMLAASAATSTAREAYVTLFVGSTSGSAFDGLRVLARTIRLHDARRPLLVSGGQKWLPSEPLKKGPQDGS